MAVCLPIELIHIYWVWTKLIITHNRLSSGFSFIYVLEVKELCLNLFLLQWLFSQKRNWFFRFLNFLRLWFWLLHLLLKVLDFVVKLLCDIAKGILIEIIAILFILVEDLIINSLVHNLLFLHFLHQRLPHGILVLEFVEGISHHDQLVFKLLLGPHVYDAVFVVIFNLDL